MLKGIRIKYKIWFETNENENSFGEKKIELLKEIERTGSIKQAASNLSIDYKLAWDMINNMNEAFEKKDLVVSKRGRNGGATITELGYYILDKYDVILKEIEEMVKNKFTV